LVRRRAELDIPGWGRIELSRGSDSRNLEKIEAALQELDREFAASIASFGVTAADPAALDSLRALAADKKLREPELKRLELEIARLVPRGLDPLREEVARLEKQHEARSSALHSETHRDDLPSDADELVKLAAKLQGEIATIGRDVAALQQSAQRLEVEIEGDRDARSAASSERGKGDHEISAPPRLRRRAAESRERLATLTATSKARHDELNHLPTTAELDEAIRQSEVARHQARAALDAVKLSESEETIRDRLGAAKEGLHAIESRLADTEREFHQTEGFLRQSEGLHQKRAAEAAWVERRKLETDRELLESEAYDRLFGLFEECRERQFGAVMLPIHDRVLRWMRLLRIGGYESIRFNDQFLPERLIAGGGSGEWLLGEESVGTIEQIGLMVRLALGSLLSTSEEPVVAMLDDPLTHSDVVRMDRMRAVLKNAAGGEVSSTPPAGPLQILVFTCHPEWFEMDGTTSIDLSRTDVLSRHGDSR
jgi:hypothetical protein